MVSEKLLAACQSSFGETSACILVTGASGFVGSEVAKTLSSLGHQVTMTGRNRYSAPRESDCLAFRRANLLDKRNIVDLCAGQDYVIHTAANTSPSATTEELYPANVEGTENIIAGCLEHGVKRLVHISSTAIYFDFQDRFDISDDHPLPKQFACGYAESKALAEQRVLEAVEQGLLNAFIVRARAVFGARDACLLPRFLRAYDAGRLRRIGDGENVSELTYIDNLVYGIILAMQRGESGEACTISGGEPVQLWELLERVLAETGRNKPLRSLSASKAMFFASILERLHRIRNKAGEPALTRYSVGLLSKSQTFAQSGASKKLGYLPIVKLSEGIDTTLKSMSACDEGHANASVKLHLQTTGYTSAKANLVEQYGERAVIKLHSAIAVLEHPEFGITLFDTGYSPSFYEATRKWPFQLLSKITPVVTYPSLSAASAVRNLGFEPEEVSRIIISHFHSDHVC
ncbi:MAG: NAD-dependent epimerase/dehydratase family protein, partial [Planctomycetota bacterium]